MLEKNGTGQWKSLEITVYPILILWNLQEEIYEWVPARKEINPPSHPLLGILILQQLEDIFMILQNFLKCAFQ